MSNREYAVELITSLTDEQVDNLVNFIVSLSGVRASENDDEAHRKREAFEKLIRKYCEEKFENIK